MCRRRHFFAHSHGSATIFLAWLTHDTHRLWGGAFLTIKLNEINELIKSSPSRAERLAETNCFSHNFLLRRTSVSRLPCDLASFARGIFNEKEKCISLTARSSISPIMRLALSSQSGSLGTAELDSKVHTKRRVAVVIAIRLQHFPLPFSSRQRAHNHVCVCVCE